MSVLEVGGSASGVGAASTDFSLLHTPDAGSERSGRGTGTRKRRVMRAQAASPDELAKVLEQIFGGASALFAMWLGVDDVAMEPEEARGIATPAASLLAKQKWAAKLTKQLADASDAIDLLMALGLYALRVQPLIAAKLAERATHGVITARSPEAVRQAAGQQHSNGARPSNQPAAPAVPSVAIPGGNGFRFAGGVGFGFDGED